MDIIGNERRYNVLTDEMKIRAYASSLAHDERISDLFPQNSQNITSSGTGASVPNQTVFLIDQEDMLLPISSNFEFDFAAGATTSSFKRWGAYGLILNMRVYVASTLTDMFQYYNFSSLSLIDLNCTIAGAQYGWKSGIPPQGNLYLNNSIANQTMTMKIPIGLLSHGALLPTYIMDKIKIEIDWAPASVAMYDNAGATPSYTISNLRYKAHYYRLDPAFTASLQNGLRTTPLDIANISYKFNQLGVNSGSGFGQQKINLTVRSLKWILAMSQDISNYSSSTQDVLFDSEWLGTGFGTTAQLKIGNLVYPLKPLSIGGPSFEAVNRCYNQINAFKDTHNVQSYSQYLGVLGTAGNYASFSSTLGNSVNATGGASIASKCYLGFNTESFASQDVQTGVSTLSRDVLLAIYPNSTHPTVNTTKYIYTFGYFDSIYQLLSPFDGVVEE